jgi:TrmH family RNA methyltransferase
MLTKARIKDIQSLGQKKFRTETGLFVAEGPRLVEELLQSRPDSVVEILALTGWQHPLLNAGSPTALTEVSYAELEKLSQLQTPHEVMAVVRQFPVTPLPVRGRITLALDQVQDPGNLGTLIRIADWFGIEQLVCQPGTADLYNPKVVQATMGSIARVQVLYTDLAAWLPVQGVPVLAATLDGEPVSAFRAMQEGILLIGNEARGIDEALLSLCTHRVTIPRRGKAESLNAAVAAGILLSHLV